MYAWRGTENQISVKKGKFRSRKISRARGSVSNILLYIWDTFDFTIFAKKKLHLTVN